MPNTSRYISVLLKPQHGRGFNGLGFKRESEKVPSSQFRWRFLNQKTRDHFGPGLGIRKFVA